MKLVKSFRGWVWKILHATSPRLEHEFRKRFSKSYWDNWGYRTKLVMACPDNAFIPRVAQAGDVIDGFQVMHNGLRVVSGSYYGTGPITLLQKNRGVHEPQEERVFQEVLKVLAPGSAILELGAYWAFYSMWFCQAVAQGRAFMVEGAAENCDMGRRNFQANGFQGHFTQALVGKASQTAPDGGRTICVDDFVAQMGLEQIAILHSDIQGSELDMLEGAKRTLAEGRVLYGFISTHSEELHKDCESFLHQRGFLTVTSVPPSQSYSLDGVLVVRSPQAPAIPPLQISLKKD